MSSGINKVILIGNLGADPEVRYTQSGSAVCNMRLAIGERRKDGEAWKEHTEWVSVSCFGRTAENAGQFLSKGRQVYVEGRLQTREYKSKDGSVRKATEVVAHEIRFLGGKGDDAPRGQSKQSEPEPQPDEGVYGDDLPF